MSGDRSIAFVAFTTAVLLHLAVFVLTSYMPITKLERPTPPSRTRYVVQFQQPAPTTLPTPVPSPPTLEPQTTPNLPVPPPVEPVPQQPVPEPVRITQQQPQPTAVEIQRPEPLDPPLELQPRQPEQPQQPVRISPRREVANVPLPQPITTPNLPVPPPVEPVPQQPVPEPVRITQQQPQPTAVEIQRPEPLDPPLELQPRQPEQPQQPVRISPRREVANVPLPQPIDSVPIKRPKPTTARQPVAVKVQPKTRPKPKVTAKPKPSPPSPPPVAPREPTVPRLPSPPPPAPPAPRPPQPAAPPAQDWQRQYLAMVAQALQRHKHYPKVARRRGLSGKVVLEFVILPNGEVTEARIITGQSTQHAVLTKAALRALKRANPLPPFPKALKKRSLRVTLPILYELRER